MFRKILLKMKNVSKKPCEDNQSSNFISNHFFYKKKYVYEIILKEKHGKVGQATDDI
jgi:hypothetical protein